MARLSFFAPLAAICVLGAVRAFAHVARSTDALIDACWRFLDAIPWPVLASPSPYIERSPDEPAATVIGLHEVRAFRDRLLTRQADGRSRAPLSGSCLAAVA